jgi:hypothetical protein
MKEEVKEKIKTFIGTFIGISMGFLLTTLLSIYVLPRPTNRQSKCKQCVQTETQLTSHLSWSPIVGWHYSYQQEKVCIKWELPKK